MRRVTRIDAVRASTAGGNRRHRCRQGVAAAHVSFGYFCCVWLRWSADAHGRASGRHAPRSRIAERAADRAAETPRLPVIPDEIDHGRRTPSCHRRSAARPPRIQSIPGNAQTPCVSRCVAAPARRRAGSAGTPHPRRRGRPAPPRPAAHGRAAASPSPAMPLREHCSRRLVNPRVVAIANIPPLCLRCSSNSHRALAKFRHRE